MSSKQPECMLISPAFVYSNEAGFQEAKLLSFSPRFQGGLHWSYFFSIFENHYIEHFSNWSKVVFNALDIKITERFMKDNKLKHCT